MSSLGQLGFFPHSCLGVIAPIWSIHGIKTAQRIVSTSDLTQTHHSQHHNMKLVSWELSGGTVHLSEILSTHGKMVTCEKTADAITINTTHTDPSVYPLRLLSPFPEPLVNQGLAGGEGGPIASCNTLVGYPSAWAVHPGDVHFLQDCVL